MSSRKADANLIPVRMLTQYAYCRRLAYMEWVQGEFAYNADVADGRYQHRNVDVPSGSKKMAQGEDVNGDAKIHARSVTVSDEKIGLVAKIDLIEIGGATVMPVEYKRGSVPNTPERAYQDHIVQLCAQGLLLRANGYSCPSGVVYYVSSKQRVQIEFDGPTVAMTLQMIKDMRGMSVEDTIPPPLVNSPKCPRCSLVGICMPDEINMLADKQTQPTGHSQIRRMYPTRGDASPVYLQEQGSRVSLAGDCIHASTRDGTVKKIRLIDVSELVLLGNIQVTTQAIREMCGRNIPVCYHTYGGWFVGITAGMSHKNVELRMRQFSVHGQRRASMDIAREIVYGKIKNSMTMLRRNHRALPGGVADELDGLARRARKVRDYQSLLGIEGSLLHNSLATTVSDTCQPKKPRITDAHNYY